MAPDETVLHWLLRTSRAARAAHTVLASHEASASRVIFVEQLLKHLSGLPVDVQDYFKEAVRCLEVGATRAAVVLSWAGLFHTVAERLVMDYGPAFRSAYPKWPTQDLVELKDQVPESQILDAAKVVGLLKRQRHRILQGHLATRNQCAHPTLYSPSINVAIGYVEELIRMTTEFTPT